MYPIDYCTILFGNIKPWIELHLKSIRKELPLNSFASFNIIDKETKDGSVEFCKNFYPDILVHSLDFYKVGSRTEKSIGSAWQWDQAYGYKYAVENCGEQPWVFIAHPDVNYLNSKRFFEGIWKIAQLEEVGCVWCGATCLIRRKAYDQSLFKFWPLFGVVFRPEPDINKPDRKGLGYVVSNRDDRLKKSEKLLTVLGFEMFELFRIELEGLNWKCMFMPDELYHMREHLCQSSGHDINFNDEKERKVWEKKRDEAQGKADQIR